MEHIDEYTKCYICLGKLVDATMCPHCNKLSCQKCIQKWLLERKSQCPLCRMTLKFSQLITCKFMNDIVNILDVFQKQKNQLEMCLEHKIHLLYFCVDCNKALCSDCYMFANTHKDHHIKHLDEIYKSHLDNVKVEINDLQIKLEKLNGFLNIIEEKIDYVRQVKNDKTTELEELYEYLKLKLEQSLSFKLSKLIMAQTMIKEKIEYLDNLKFKINRSICDFSQTMLINKSEDIIKQIQNQNIDSEIENEYTNVNTDFQSEITPSYESSKYEITEFRKIAQEKEVIYSSELNTNGLSWKLKIYPNGNGVAKNEYISIFLELISGLSEDSKYFYKIELVNYENKNNYFREFSSEFKNGECWGYNRFYKLDQLEKDGFIENLTGKLSLKFFVRPMTYTQLCRDQNNYINKLKKMLIQEDSESEKIEEKLELNVIDDGNNAKKEEAKHNEIELNQQPIKEEKERIIIEEENKTHHFIDHNDNNIDFKPTSPIKKLNANNNNPISMNLNENQHNFNNNNNNKINNNIVFNPVLDNFAYSDEDNSFLSIMDSIQMIDSQQFNKRDLNNIVMNSNNVRKNSLTNNDYLPYSQKQLDRERADIYNEFLQSHSNNRVGKIRKQLNLNDSSDKEGVNQNNFINSNIKDKENSRLKDMRKIFNKNLYK